MKKCYLNLLTAACVSAFMVSGIGYAAEDLVEVTDSTEEELIEDAGFTYEDLSGYTFVFSSGAGGWDTTLTIGEDGTFSGVYHDSEMGDTGDDYPNGSYYYCEFSGKLGTPASVNDYTYSLPIEELNLANTVDTEEIKDGLRYIYSDAYGLTGTDTLLLYLPGAALSDLPQEYLTWIGYYDLTATEETELKSYGLYNEAEQQGFSSSNNIQTLKEDLTNAETQDAALLNSIENDALTQTELNEKSAGRYTLWDDLLNEIWAVLKTELSEEEMSALTTEEIAWINEKEQAVADAGAQSEGGSGQALAQNTKAADMTKERVYVLMDLLG